jgi:hypothetical protein
MRATDRTVIATAGANRIVASLLEDGNQTLPSGSWLVIVPRGSKARLYEDLHSRLVITSELPQNQSGRRRVVTLIGALLFWAGALAWIGARITLRATTNNSRFGGAFLLLGGSAGLFYGIRLLAA